MKTKLSSLGWLALLLPFLGVGLVHAASTTMSFRDDIRSVSGFRALSNSGSIHVEVSFGDQESVRLAGDEKAIREIETVVENGTLNIRYKKGAWTKDRNWGSVKAYVTARQLNALSQSGSGTITVSGTLSGKELNASLSGSGRITFASGADVCNVAISGSGRVVAKGSASESNVSISGSGQFDGGDLKSRSASAKISGSGNITIHAEQTLDAAISGSGNVNYSGNAETRVQTSGSGRVRRI